MHFIVIKGGADRYVEKQKNSSKFQAKLESNVLSTDILFLTGDKFMSSLYVLDRVGVPIYFINKLVYIVNFVFILFLLLCAQIVVKLSLTWASYTTRELTYPSQQDRERAALEEEEEEEDGVLVVSLFVTLIMESPLARGPWVRSTNEAALLSFTTGLAAGRARITKLGKYSIRI